MHSRPLLSALRSIIDVKLFTIIFQTKHLFKITFSMHSHTLCHNKSKGHSKNITKTNFKIYFVGHRIFSKLQGYNTTYVHAHQENGCLNQSIMWEAFTMRGEGFPVGTRRRHDVAKTSYFRHSSLTNFDKSATLQ